MQPSVEEALRDLEIAVQEAVARFGVAGAVEIAGRTLNLTGPGGRASYDLGSLPEQWHALPADERRRRVNEMVRTLVAERRSSMSPAAPVNAPRTTLPSSLVTAAVLAAAVLGAWAVFRAFTAQPRGTTAPATSTSSAPDPEAQAEARARRVCEATESRVMRGATVGPADVEGWVVELVLLRAGPGEALEFDPGLTAFVDRRPGQSTGRVVWPPVASLTSVEAGLGHVEISDASLPSAAAPRRRGVRLTFHGRYVVPYFREEERIDFIRLANALAARLGARHGALYARCAHSKAPQLGSWFHGGDPAGTVASMIQYMGLDASAPHVTPALGLAPDGGPADRAEVLAKIESATRSLDRDKVLRLAGRHGGGLAGREGDLQSLTFPFKDGNRAARASRDIARALGIGTER